MNLKGLDGVTWIRVSLVFLLLLLITGFGIVNIHGLKLAVDAEQRSRDQLLAIGAVLSDVRDMETGQRGFLLSGDEAYLAPFVAAQTRIDDTLDELERLSDSSGEAHRRQLARVREIVANKVDELEYTLGLRKERGLEAAIEVLSRDQGRVDMENLRGTLDEMARDVAATIRDRETYVERAYQRSIAVKVSGGLVGVIVLGTLVMVLSRSLRQQREDAERFEDQAIRLERVASISTTVYAANTRSSVIGIVEEESRRILAAARAEVVLETPVPPTTDTELVCALRGRSGDAIGYLHMVADGGRPFDGVDRAIAAQLANMATVALDNAKLYEELQEASRRKDQFLATLAHELRNPLAPIGNAVQILDRGAADPDAAARCREIIARQLRQLTRLVDDLMDISRISRGKVRLRRARVDLSEVVDAAVESAKPALDEEHHALRVALPAEPIVLDVDPDRVAQVLLNLLKNAAKCTDPGGHVELHAERLGSQVAVRVRDDGVGLEPDEIERVFELFTQVERPGTRARDGLGVGLALVRQLVELHGGHVVARSEGRGKGCEFEVLLPALDPETAASADAASSDRPSAAPRRLRILVVDDNRDAADTLAELLRLEGHDVETRYDGESAIQCAAAARPDLAFLDIGLPGFTGHDVARILRRDLAEHRMVLVALTGWGQPEDRKRSVEAGFDHHLVKPLDPDSLVQLLAACSQEVAVNRSRHGEDDAAGGLGAGETG